MNRRLCGILARLVVASVALLVAQRSHAQVPGAGADEIEIGVEQIGVGGVFREGELAGFRFTLIDHADEPRNVALRLHLTDADGDKPVYERVLALTPELRVGVWLYARMPFRVDSILNVTAHEGEIREDGTIAIGRQVGALRAPLRQGARQDAARSMFAVIGDRSAGLEQYAQDHTGQGMSLTSHEITTVVAGIPADPNALPDDWKGWAPYEVILWASGDPLAIGADAQSQAIREWVNRGGHLVVLVPPIGNTWNAEANPLADLVPRATFVRHEDRSLEPYRELLVTPEFATRPLPARTVVHSFRIDPDVARSEAIPIIEGPEGEAVVVRRLVGTGMVTFIGLDLLNRQLAPTGTLRADAFWHRVLGRRADMLDPVLARQWQQKSMVPAGSEPMWVDRTIASIIGKEKDAGFGLLMGLIVFIAYWLVSGPLGFAMLKRTGRVRHAWLAFVASSAVFTLIAWAGANTFRLKGTGADHLTVVEHVYGQGVQSARMWASVFLPRYGESRITAGDPASDEDAQWHQSLTPWADPAGISFSAFPDARSYEIDVRRGDTAVVPARSTIKQVQVDWLGAPRWETPSPTGADARPAIGADGQLAGVLVHGLPAALERVQVVLVRRQLTPDEVRTRRKDRTQTHDGLLLADAYAWGIDEWAPGQALDLSTLGVSAASRADGYLGEKKLVPRYQYFAEEFLAPDGRDFERMTFYGVLEPPDYSAKIGSSRRARIARRQAHGLDLSEWFTQPCLIIYGEIDDGPSPVPLEVDGRACPTTGRTIFRWVYPLAPDPPRFVGKTRT